MQQIPPLALIAAISQNGVIGKENDMPWHHPNDLRFFRRMTVGHTLIMGRKTFNSLGKPLPGRRHFVLSRQPKLVLLGTQIFGSLEQAIERARKYDPCPIIMGGAEIYKLALPRATLMYLTHIDEEIEGDAFFPEFQQDQWKIVESIKQEKLRFVTYQREDG